MCYNVFRKWEEETEMTPDYYEAHEAEWLEEQELLAELFAEEWPQKLDKGERRKRFVYFIVRDV